MMDDLSTWLMGTPDQVQAQLAGLAASGIARVMVSVNCDLHREMLPFLPRLRPARAGPQSHIGRLTLPSTPYMPYSLMKAT
jgi:hypothetical protein